MFRSAGKPHIPGKESLPLKFVHVQTRASPEPCLAGSGWRLGLSGKIREGQWKFRIARRRRERGVVGIISSTYSRAWDGPVQLKAGSTSGERRKHCSPLTPPPPLPDAGGLSWGINVECRPARGARRPSAATWRGRAAQTRVTPTMTEIGLMQCNIGGRIWHT